MAKKKPIAATIYCRAEVPCIRTGKTDHVLNVAIGDYILPLHISELWKEVPSANDQTSSGKDASKPKSAVSPSS